MSARGSGFAKVIPVSEAKNILLSKSKRTFSTEIIESVNAMDRILSEDIISKVDLPGFTRSAMDGYAVRSKDTIGASESNPITLKILGQVEIGDTNTINLVNTGVIRISTGAPLPDNADAVIKIEDCEIIDENTVDILSAAHPGKHVAEKDEDVKKDSLIFKSGHLLKPWDIALLESIGAHKIEVNIKPKIAILSTGSELIKSGEIPKIGQVIDSNRPAIQAWLSKFNVEVIYSGKEVDEQELLKQKLLELAENADLIITTGGTSVGSKDYIPNIIKSIGELWVHGVAIRPGKPLALGQITTSNGNSSLIIGLPGYPLAAFLNFYLFVSKLLYSWCKVQPEWGKMTEVKLKQKIPSASGLRDFVRLKETGDGAEVIRITGAGILSSLTFADYLLEIPENVEGYPKDSIVKVMKLRGETNG